MKLFIVLPILLLSACSSAASSVYPVQPKELSSCLGKYAKFYNPETSYKILSSRDDAVMAEISNELTFYSYWQVFFKKQGDGTVVSFVKKDNSTLSYKDTSTYNEARFRIWMNKHCIVKDPVLESAIRKINQARGF